MNVDEKKGLDAKLEAFFEGAKSGVLCLRELRKKYNKEMAFDFNSLQFFRPGENKTSEILAFFLNPEASHGQGCAFLKCFCSKFASNLRVDDYSEAKVYTEYFTDESRRIDIVIEFPREGSFVGIENKIWAADQPDQLGHYSRFLEKESEGRYHLIYLSPYGKDPSECSISPEEFERLSTEGKASILSYQEDIISLFDEFVKACAAENVQAFLKDFQKYLKQQYRGETMMSGQAYIQEFIAKPENMSIALEVASQVSVVKEKLWQKTVEQIRGWASEEDVVLKNELPHYSERAKSCTSLFCLSDSCVEGWYLMFQFQSRDLSRLYVILCGDNKTVGVDELLKAQKLIDLPHENRGVPNIHREFRPYSGGWGIDVFPWDAMNTMDEKTKTNQFASAIIDEFRKTRKVMRGVLSKV